MIDLENNEGEGSAYMHSKIVFVRWKPGRRIPRPAWLLRLGHAEILHSILSPIKGSKQRSEIVSKSKLPVTPDPNARLCVFFCVKIIVDLCQRLPTRLLPPTHTLFQDILSSSVPRPLLPQSYSFPLLKCHRIQDRCPTVIHSRLSG
jgi:hypothetical protein